MCDFSQYGGKTDELKALLETLPAPPELSDEELKRVTNEGREDASREAMKSLSSKVVLQNHSVVNRDGTRLEARTYRPSSVDASKLLPIYIHFHGGGFFFGTLSSEDATCSLIATDVEVVVFNINYRHSPEFSYPTAWEDSEDAFHWVCKHTNDFGGDKSRIVIGGISAGGMLTSSLMQTLERTQVETRSNILGQVLMIPSTVHEANYEPLLKQLKSPAVSSYPENEKAPILPLTRLRFFNNMLFPKAPNSADRRANPGLASKEEVSKLPPATFGVCGLDPLRDEGLLYAKLLQESGVPTNVHVFKGLPHGYRRFGSKLSSASDAWDEVMHGGIRWALSKPQVQPEFVIHEH